MHLFVVSEQNVELIVQLLYLTLKSFQSSFITLRKVVYVDWQNHTVAADRVLRASNSFFVKLFGELGITYDLMIIESQPKTVKVLVKSFDVSTFIISPILNFFQSFNSLLTIFQYVSAQKTDSMMLISFLKFAAFSQLLPLSNKVSESFDSSVIVSLVALKTLKITLLQTHLDKLI